MQFPLRNRHRAGWLALAFLWCSMAVAQPAHLIFWKGPFSSAREAATALRKPILLHFQTDNPFDKQFDTIVYRDPDVVLFTGHTCLPFLVRADAMDSENVAIVAQYHVKDFPTVILINHDGTEIDRMVGYQTPRQFLLTLQDFVNDTNTVGNLRNRLRADTTNLALAFQLAVRYELRTEVDSAMWLMRAIISRGDDSMFVVQSAKLHLATFEARALNSATLLGRFVDESPIDSLRRSAVAELLGFYQRHKWIDSTRAVFERAIVRWQNDAELFNDYAWFLAEQPGSDLARAEQLAARAVALEPGEAEYYDTRAYVFAKRQMYNEALMAIEIALRLRPDDQQFLARRAAYREALGAKAKRD